MRKTRTISSEEAEVLLNLSFITENGVEILVATADDDIFSMIQDSLSSEHDITVRQVSSSCDALISCAQDMPELLVIDEEINTVPVNDIVQSLKKHPELQHIRILCLRKTVDQDEKTGCIADEHIFRSDISKEVLSYKIISLLHGGVEDSQSKRHWPRKKIHLVAKLLAYNPKDIETMGKGEAKLENISLGGAYLTHISLPDYVPWDENTHLRLTVDQPPLDNVLVDSVIVRMTPDNEAGVKFEQLSSKDRIKIRELFEKSDIQ